MKDNEKLLFLHFCNNAFDINCSRKNFIYKSKWKNDINDTVKNVTKKVNGGYNGLSDRVNKFNSCEIYIDCIT